MRLVISTMFGLLLLATVGCAGRGSIPSSAHLVQEGNNALSFTAPSNGTVYVLDATDNKKVYQGKIDSGNQLVVQPSLGLIVQGGNNVNLTDTLALDHRYQIFFDPGH